MKRKYLFLIVMSLLTQYVLFAQEVNYRSMDKTKHLISAQFGADYGSYYGVSYGYVLRTKHRPLVVGTEFTIPFGNDVLDDWKWKVGAQAELWSRGNFSLVLKPSVILRRYESSMARMYNVGTDFTLNVGYVKQRWGAVAVAGFDKAIVTHIRNKILKEYYPEIRDGWYIPSGGNFKFGTRLHYSTGTWNTFVTIGKHFGQDFKDNPTLPFFVELSVQKRLR